MDTRRILLSVLISLVAIVCLMTILSPNNVNAYNAEDSSSSLIITNTSEVNINELSENWKTTHGLSG